MVMVLELISPPRRDLFDASYSRCHRRPFRNSCAVGFQPVTEKSAVTRITLP
jgi:hypothetical protein